MEQREITFYSEGTKMVDNIYLPDDYKEGEKWPGIVANSGWTGVNRVYPVMFTRQMAARGFVCMGFGYRSFKLSGGISGMDKYTTLEMEIDNIDNAVTFFRHQPEMDADHVALIGWGVGDAVCIAATHRDKTMKAMATLNSFTDGRRWVRTGMGNDKFNKMLRTLKEDKCRRVIISDPILRHPYEFCPNIDESGDFHVEKTLENLNSGVKGDIEVECSESFPTSMSNVITENFVRFNVQGILPKLAPDCTMFVGHGEYDELHDKGETEDAYRLTSELKQLHYVDGEHSEWMLDEDPRLGSLCDATTEFFRVHIQTQF